VGEVIVREATAADYDGIFACMQTIQADTAAQKAVGFNRDLWDWQYVRTTRPTSITVAEEAGRLVGYFHLLLLDMYHAGRVVLGGLIQDVATHPDMRGRGLFREVGRVAIESMRARGVKFAIGIPNHRSLHSFVHNHGYAMPGRMPVYLLPLDVGAVLASRLGVLGRVAGAVASPLYRGLRARPRPLAAGEVVARLDTIPDEISEVSAAFAGRVTTAVVRSASYLRWRLVEKPTHEYSVYGLRREGQLVAYVATRVADLLGTRCLLLMDLGCRDGADASLLRLVSARVEAARAEGLGMVVTMGVHPFFATLRGLGFVRAPERFNPRPFYFIVKPLADDLAPEVTSLADWLVTLVDWDVM
jgi:predicted N-acetyltransferase YhbS